MRAVVQRVSSARVEVDGENGPEVVGTVEPGPAGQGLVVLLGATHGDDAAAAAALARKTWRLRILDGERSASDVGAPILVVSQFTVYADTAKGRRPSWSPAAPGPVAEPLIDAFAAELRALGAHVEQGRFGAHMRVRLVNDGPVTLILEA